MGTLPYLMNQKLEEIKKNGGKFLLYFIIFYIGLLLPTFSLANYSNLKQDLRYYSIRNHDHVVLLTWFSTHYDKNLFDNERASLSMVYRTTLANGKTLIIHGVDDNYEQYRHIDKLRGRFVNINDMSQVAPICIIGQGLAEELHLDIGDYLDLPQLKLKVAGIMDDPKRNEEVNIPITTLDYYFLVDGGVAQFNGLFFDNAISPEELGASLEQRLEAKGITKYRFQTGEAYWTEIMRTINRWRTQRLAVAVVACIFFVVNSMITLSSKLESEKKNIAIRMAIGARLSTEVLFSMIESVLIALVAAVGTLVSLFPLCRWIGLERYMTVDSFTVISVLLTAIGMGGVINLVVIKKLKGMEIYPLLNTGD